MKTKMKSAFAFIAVALMIMVAVVPMVSVFSDEADAAVEPFAAEYDNSVKTPIVISGTVNDSKNNPLKNVPVTVEYDGKKVAVITGDSGEYSVTTTVSETGLIKEVKVTVDSKTEKVKGEVNEAYGMEFPVVTFNSISASTTMDVISNTALVTGMIVTKDNETVYVSDVSITGAVGTVKTVNGAFSFYGKIGSEYTLSASAVGTQFKAEKFILDADGYVDVELIAEKNIATFTLSLPLAPSSFTVEKAEGNNVNSVTGLGSITLGKNGEQNYAYALINYATTAIKDDQSFVKTKFTVNYSDFVEKVGVEIGNDDTDDRKKVVPVDDEGSIGLKLYTGSVIVGDKAVTPSSVDFKGKYTLNEKEQTKTLKAKIIGTNWYVSKVAAYGGDVAVDYSSYIVNATFAGYAFDVKEDEDGDFEATNAVKITGNVDKLPTGVYESAIKVTATNYVAGKLTLTPSENGLKYEFYVPMNTSVTIEAPSADYKPSKYVNDKVTADTEIETFIYDSSVEYTTYTGKVTLNGVAISLIGTDLAYSIDGGITFKAFGSTGAAAATFESNAYSFDLPKTIDAKDVFVKVAQTYTTGYAFDTTYKTAATSGKGYYYNFFGVTGTAVADIPVKAEEISVTVKDGNEPAAANIIEGQKVNFYMSDKASLDEVAKDKKKVDLGSATTDAKGIASIMAGKVGSSGYKIYAIPEGDATLGAYVLSGINVTDGTITSTSKTTSGTVITDKGVIVSDPKVSYVEYNATGIVLGEGKAKVVDGKYYIVSKSDVSKVVIKVDGYELVNDTVAVGSMTADLKDAKAVAPVVVKYNVSYEGSYYNYVNVTTGDFAKGKVITLSAASEFTIEDTENLYADGYTKYTFKAWYVNGKQISTDAITSYTVGDENIVVSADYTSEHVTVADGKQKDDGVDSNVMIIGIAAVVVALIAVVYAVIQKKE